MRVQHENKLSQFEENSQLLPWKMKKYLNEVSLDLSAFANEKKKSTKLIIFFF